MAEDLSSINACGHKFGINRKETFFDKACDDVNELVSLQTAERAQVGIFHSHFGWGCERRVDCYIKSRNRRWRCRRIDYRRLAVEQALEACA